ncbi:MAG TPA: protein kinase, partial [Bryobacteraceae bacterium]
MTTLDTIAHYRVTGKLGAGGMGEVYRATDTKLGRPVALKVIPEKFAQDAARMSWFRREAQVLASLNHPNIAAIYGVEERALVMELVEGATLAERLSTGPVPVEEALPIARQIADALEYAHEHGIVHRDLKPSNIKITPEGRVKVLDFGLAKALASDTANAPDPEVSPTITLQSATGGIVIGTAGYMSPEQARGKAVDKRTDIWAFGVVLAEMLTGRPVFPGETISDTLAAVLRSEIDYSHLPSDTPPGVRSLIGRCLERDPARRLRDIGDAGILMDSAPASVLAVTPAKSGKNGLPWVAGLLAGATLAACIAWLLWPVYSPEPIRFDLNSPEGARAFYPTVSPDGRCIAFVQARNRISLYVRRLDRPEDILVPGSEASNSRPFWSPDSRRLGFFSGGKLNVAILDGGDVQTLIDGQLAGNATSYSGAWSNTGVILFTQAGKPIYRIPDTGGTATPVL